MAWRGHKAGGVWQIFCAERFGSYPLRWDGEAPVWIHAVSLGETRAAQSLITLLLSQGNRILLTHTTPKSLIFKERNYLMPKTIIDLLHF